jgi:hypothetical protein
MNRRDILAMVGSTVALSSVSTIADVLPDTADVMSDKMPVHESLVPQQDIMLQAMDGQSPLQLKAPLTLS